MVSFAILIPISDTTILSATGADCSLYDHFSTQLTYAIVAAIIAGFGYIVLALTGNVWFGLIAVLVGLILLAFTRRNKPKQIEKQMRK